MNPQPHEPPSSRSAQLTKNLLLYYIRRLPGVPMWGGWSLDVGEGARREETNAYPFMRARGRLGVMRSRLVLKVPLERSGGVRKGVVSQLQKT